MPSRTLTIGTVGRCETVPGFAACKVNTKRERESATSAQTVACNWAATVRESLTAVPEGAVRTTDSKDAEDLFGPKTTRLCDCHSSSLSIAVRATARTSSSGSFSASSTSSGIVSSASM